MKTLILAVLLFLGGISTIFAQEEPIPITLRLHQPIPSSAHIPNGILAPWATQLETLSAKAGLDVTVELYPSMQLGGKPADLFQQVEDGVIDLVWTVLGYTPGRFPVAETFELPFIMHGVGPTSCGFHEFMETHGQPNRDIKVLAWHTQSSHVFYSRIPIYTLNDLHRINNLRVGSTVMRMFFEEAGIGSKLTGMPIPEVLVAFQTNNIQAATLSWGLGPTYGMGDLVNYHTEFFPDGTRGWYTQTFAFIMNRSSYDALPETVRAIIDSPGMSGSRLSVNMSRVMHESDIAGRRYAEHVGNEITSIATDADLDPWLKIGEATRQRWLADMAERGYTNANRLIIAAERAINRCSSYNWIESDTPLFSISDN